MQLQRRWHSNAAAAICKLANRREPVAAIRCLTDALLEETDAAAPVDLEVLGSMRRIRRVEFADITVAGMLVPEDSGYCVKVNRRHQETKQRFTIAHEIGHTFFREASKTSVGSSDVATGLFDISQDEEYLCDMAAANLLLNPKWLRPMSSAAKPGLRALIDIAHDCRASLEATGVELARLGAWQCSFIFWEPGLRKAERVRPEQMSLGDGEDDFRPTPRLRARTVLSAPGLPYFPENKSAGEDTSINQALREHSEVFGDESFLLKGRRQSAYCESIFAPFHDEAGVLRSRVISYVSWVGLADPDGSATLLSEAMREL